MVPLIKCFLLLLGLSWTAGNCSVSGLLNQIKLNHSLDFCWRFLLQVRSLPAWASHVLLVGQAATLAEAAWLVEHGESTKYTLQVRPAVSILVWDCFSVVCFSVSSPFSVKSLNLFNLLQIALINWMPTLLSKSTKS